MKTKAKITRFVITIIAIIIAVLCAGTFMATYSAKATDTASEAEEVIHEPKIHVEIDLDAEYDDSCIIVALDKYTSGVNKQHDPDIFGDFPKTSITDLTHIDGDISELEYLNEDEFRQIFRIGLPVAGEEQVIAAIERANKAEGVLWADLDYTEGIVMSDSVTASTTGIYYDDQWGLHGTYGIRAEEAWELLENSTSSPADIRIGVIDSGIAAHYDLDGKLEQGYDFVNNNMITTDDPTGHGTHVAGIIAASGLMAGVYDNVSLVPLQVSYWDTIESEYLFLPSAIVESINYAISNDIQIINYSGGGNIYRAQIDTAISNYDGLFVTTAGNGEWQEESNTYEISDIDFGKGAEHYPGSLSCNNIITVGALSSSGSPWAGSNYGNRSVDIFAPGADIISTYPYGEGASLYYDYSYMSGTSMAAPHVTGVAAMLLSYDSTLTADEIKAAILCGAVEMSSLNGLCMTEGRLDAYNALYNVVYDQTYTYTVNFSAGSTLSSRPVSGSGSSRTYTHGVPTYLGGGGFSITGYEIAGWSTKTAPFIIGQGTDIEPEYMAGDYVTGVTYDSSITLYAVWRPRSWYTTVQTDGKLHNLTTYEMHYDGPTRTVTAADKEGYEFIEWRRYYNNSSGYKVLGTSKTITLYPNELIPSGNFANVNEIFIIATFEQLPEEEDDSCLAPGTLITLADGTHKAVEDLTGDEMLLVWDMETGTFGSAPIVFVDSELTGHYEVITLTFSDDTTVEVISEHGFWDADLNEYVYLDENAEDYIGHSFLKQSGNIMTEVTLTDVDISAEITEAYSPVTYGHLCYYVNGMLSMPGGIDGLFNIFDVDPDTLTIDEESYAADIAEYGLYTYEEFSEIFPVGEEVFEAFNGRYLKVAVGKGLITPDRIGELIERYSEPF